MNAVHELATRKSSTLATLTPSQHRQRPTASAERLDPLRPITTEPPIGVSFAAIPVGATSTPPTMQAKAVVGQPGDEYERQADQVADGMTEVLSPSVSATSSPKGPVGEMRSHRGWPERRMHINEGRSSMQLKADLAADTTTPPFLNANGPATFRDGGAPLPAQARSLFEGRFGRDFSQVRVHTDSHAAELTRGLQAQALTVGQHISFATGRYSPTSPDGRKLLAHELTHVVQQSSSHSRAPRFQLKGRGPGSCGVLDEAAATVLGGAAHLQIQQRLSTRGLLPEMPIPRASKTANLGSLRCQPLGSEFGYADVTRLAGPNVGISEIKPFWRASVQGRLEALHYQLRSRQSKQRLLRTGACSRDLPGFDDNAFRLEVRLTPTTSFQLLKGAIAGDEDFGPFKMDQRKNLMAKEVGAGAIGYWCKLNDDGKRRKKREEDEKRKKKEKEKEKEKEKDKKKEDGEKEKKDKGKGSAGAANVGFGISIFSSQVGGANAGVGVSVGSNSASVGSAGAGISWFSDSAAAGAVGAGISKDSQTAGAAAAGAGISVDSAGAAVGAAGAGKSSGVTGVGAGVASAGKSEDSAMAAAGTAGKGDVSGSMVARAGSAGSGDTTGAVGAGAGSSRKPIDSQDVSGSGADQVPHGQSDEEVAGKGGGKLEGSAGEATGSASGGHGGTKSGGAGSGPIARARTNGTGGGTGAGGQQGSAGGPGVAGVPGVAGGNTTGVAQPGGLETQGAGAVDRARTSGAGGASGQSKSLGNLAVLPVFPSTASESERQMIAAEAARVAALLGHSTEAQRLFLQNLAAQAPSGQYLVPTSVWVAKLLKVTEGLSAEDIEYLKNLDWKPGHLSEQELRERVRNALANRKQAPTGETGRGGQPGPAKAEHAGGGAGKAGAGTERGKPLGPASGQGTRSSDRAQSPGGGRDRATAPPEGANREPSGRFGFAIISGLKASSDLKPSQSVRCVIRISELDGQRRTFVLDGVWITFDGRKDASTVHIHFTTDFWSTKYKFYGRGGADSQGEYSFGGRPGKH